MVRRELVAAVAVWVTLIAVAVALSVAAAANDTLPGDMRIADWVQGLAAPGETVSEVIQTITSTEVVLATGAGVVVVLWLKGYRRPAVLLACGLLVLAVLQPALKAIIDRPRPDPALVEVREGHESSSFPSGHVMSATVLYGFLLYLAMTLPLRTGARYILGASCGVLVLLPGLVGAWLGVHWPTDILGGWLWGLALVYSLLAVNVATCTNSPDFSER